MIRWARDGLLAFLELKPRDVLNKPIAHLLTIARRRKLVPSTHWRTFIKEQRRLARLGRRGLLHDDTAVTLLEIRRTRYLVVIHADRVAPPPGPWRGLFVVITPVPLGTALSTIIPGVTVVPSPGAPPPHVPPPNVVWFPMLPKPGT